MRRARGRAPNIRAVGYDLDGHVLEVEFHNGGVYDYLDVPPEEALALLESDSLGRYLNAEIKPRDRFRPVRRGSSAPRQPAWACRRSWPSVGACTGRNATSRTRRLVGLSARK